jgi:hypothetical protein
MPGLPVKEKKLDIKKKKKKNNKHAHIFAGD